MLDGTKSSLYILKWSDILSILHYQVQMLLVKTGLFIKLGSTFKPFTTLTQYCYVKLFQKIDHFLTDQVNFRLPNSSVSLSNVS